MSKTPTTLIIMDGFGIGPQGPGNAVTNARTPVLDKLFAENPGSRLSASGLDVGLPEGQMGNSEVGHTNIGAGRVVFQDLPRVSKAIADGKFFENPAYLQAMDSAKSKGKALHLMGLLSDGGVHSHIEHIFAAMDMAKRRGLEEVYVHAFLDGRDTPPSSGKGFVEALVKKCDEVGNAKVGVISGRFYAMDRDKRWERLVKAYNALVLGEAPFEPNPVKAVEDSYGRGLTDEFVEPVLCCREATIGPDDSVIFMNFRPDRAREITRSLVDPAFDGFPRKDGALPLNFVCTTEYDATMPNVTVAFTKQKLDNIFGEYISRMGLTQLRIAETEKYAHVTFFFNGGQEAPCEGEDRALIASPKVATYDLKPEMSALEVTDEAVKRIESGHYDVVILNFANCDMVGHTGIFDAAVAAVETVDACVGRVVDATLSMGGVALITADHGNAERMVDEDGKTPYTAHTTNLVPFYIIGADVTLRDGRLSDIAPTMLDLMGLAKPAEMDGVTLIEK